MTTCYKKTTKKSSRGFTLIEIMVALTVLAVLTLGGAMMLGKSKESVVRQRNKRAAIVAANQRMEQIRTMPYPDFDFIGDQWISLILHNSSFKSGTNETIQVNGKNMPIATVARHITSSGVATNSYAAGTNLQFQVSLVYSGNDTIVLISQYR